MVRVLIFGIVASLSYPHVTSAQDHRPTVVSERIQQIAAELPISDRLGFKWLGAEPADIGRYMGLLAAANEIAIGIAKQNARDAPTDEDYQAALAALCLWPNKPPLAEPLWSKASAAFSSPNVREALQAAVGPLAVSLPAAIAAGEGASSIETRWPTVSQEYFEKVLDLESLPDVE